MRRDTEIGVIAGIVLAIIIGVFISTRTVVKEPTIPLSHTYEGKSAGNEAQDLGVSTQPPLTEIAELPEDRPGEIIPAATAQAIIQKEEDEAAEVLEGQWGEDMVEDELEEEAIEGEWEEIELQPTTVVKETKRATTHVPPEIKEPVTAIHGGEDIVYKVKPNDTLAKLAREYYGDEAKWPIIYDANVGKISNRNALYVGQEIVIPAISTTAEEPMLVEHLDSPPSQAVVAPEGAERRTHKVQKGDTLFKLARQYYNNEAEWKKIYNANRDVIPNPNAILQGTVLIIPE